jgi:hypothetical protein
VARGGSSISCKAYQTLGIQTAMAEESKAAVIVAKAANFPIAAAKLIAGLAGGSTAMLARSALV